MTKVVTSFNNFARGRIDHDMNGRFDLPIYATGADWFDNFISNFKGNAIFRSGFENMVTLEDCELIEFKFSSTQAYIAVFTANKIRFLAYDGLGNFGWVLSAGVPIEVATPYTLADCKKLDYTQNNDVMVLTVQGYDPRKLTRTSANSFTLTAFSRTIDPFVTLIGANAITAISQANPASVTSAAHGFATGDQVLITGVVGMTQVNGGIYTITVTGANTFTLNGINSTAYTAYASGGSVSRYKVTAITAATQANPAVITSAAHGLVTGDRVTIYNVLGMTQLNGLTYTVTVIDANTFSLNGVNSTGFTAYASGGLVRRLGDFPACCLFYKGRLYYANTLLKPTTIFGSKSGAYDDFTLTPVDAKSALIFTLSDIAQPIDWLFPGDNSLIAGASDGIVAINGGSVGTAITAATVEANITSAEPSNGIYPVAKDGLIFYPGRTSRNLNYFSYDLLSERFNAKDANFISYDITEGGLGKIRWKKDKNDLIFAICDGTLLSLNFNEDEKIVGWHSHSTQGDFKNMVVIPDNLGNPQLFALTLRSGVYYLERQATYVEFSKRTEFRSGRDKVAKKRDQMAYIRKVAEELKSCRYLDNSQTVSNLQSNLITYNPGTGVVTATNNVFAANHVGKHIVYKTATGYESGRFEITGYTDAKNVTVDVLQTPSSNVYTDWYLTFNQISGLGAYVGVTLGVVTDGGFLDSKVVPVGGVIDLGKEVTHATVGLGYEGLIKSFSLGFQVQGANTQTTFKTANRVGVRCTTTAGGKFGTDYYNMVDIQKLKQGDLNYLPPVPIDGTEFESFGDDAEFDKFYYIAQVDPLPMTVTAVMIEANYSLAS